jgi:Rieske Fe-S protein
VSDRTDVTARLPRRAVLAAAAGLGATAACGRDAPATGTAPSAPPPTGPAAGPSVGAGLESVSATRAPRPVAPASDIPVGGGRVFPDLRVVVTQPTTGEFRGFGIVCTHDGCELNAVANGTINCPCHGSRYAITDGSVVQGPARTGLRTYSVRVDGDEVVLL